VIPTPKHIPRSSACAGFLGRLGLSALPPHRIPSCLTPSGPDAPPPWAGGELGGEGPGAGHGVLAAEGGEGQPQPARVGVRVRVVPEVRQLLPYLSRGGITRTGPGGLRRGPSLLHPSALLQVVLRSASPVQEPHRPN